jgi:hypothetical protein
MSGLLKNNSAHTASSTHYLSFKSGLLKNNSAHTASPTHYLSFKSGLLKNNSRSQNLLGFSYTHPLGLLPLPFGYPIPQRQPVTY